MSVPKVDTSQAAVTVPNTKVQEAETLLSFTSSRRYCKVVEDLNRIESVADDGITPPLTVAKVQPVPVGE